MPNHMSKTAKINFGISLVIRLRTLTLKKILAYTNCALCYVYVAANSPIHLLSRILSEDKATLIVK